MIKILEFAVKWFSLPLLLAITISMPLRAEEVAARVLYVVGQVHATSDHGRQRRLANGDVVYAGDTLESGGASAAQLVFSDNGRMAVRADTTVKITEYRYDAEDRGRSRSLIALFEGAIRSITGLIGRYNKNNVVIETPLATLGIRGTDHETIHISSDIDGDKSASLAGTYNKVYSGGTVLKTPDGALLLDPSQVGFVSGRPGKAGCRPCWNRCLEPSRTYWCKSFLAGPLRPWLSWLPTPEIRLPREKTARCRRWRKC